MTINANLQKLIFAGIVIFYLCSRFVFGRFIDSFGAYASYAFESLFCIVVIATFFRNKFKLFSKPSKFVVAQIILAPAIGYLIYSVMVTFRMAFPFDLRNSELIVLLLVVGPILEEFIFRQALFFPLEDLLKKPILAVFSTAAIFSFSHFYAYSFVPDQIKSFVLYQTGYTLFLGLWWGSLYARTRAISWTILAHIGLNFGFWLGSF
ncbi:MAG: lysostaphin resistance A-like protein [Bacteriovoracia bacterium]